MGMNGHRLSVNGVDKADKPAMLWRRGPVSIFEAWPQGMAQVTGTLRRKDQLEIFGLMWGPDKDLLARLAMHSTLRYIAVGPSGTPGAAFGAQEAWPKHWSFWLFGNQHFGETVRTLSRFVRTIVYPDLLKRGLIRAETHARSGPGNTFGYIERMGAAGWVPLPEYGADGSDYRLYHWTRESIARVIVPVKR